MTSGELRKLLEQIDPEGKLEVCSDNISVMEAYVDTKQQGWIHKVNKDKSGYVKNISLSDENRIVLCSMSIPEAVKQYDNLNISIDGKDKNGHNRQLVEDWISESPYKHKVVLTGEVKKDEAIADGQYGNYGQAPLIDIDNNDDDDYEPDDPPQDDLDEPVINNVPAWRPQPQEHIRNIRYVWDPMLDRAVEAP